MMQVHAQHVLALPALDHHHPQKRRQTQVERPHEFVHQLVGLHSRFLPVLHRKVHRCLHPLHHLPVPQLKPRAQRLVPTDHRPDRRLHLSQFQAALHHIHAGDIVRRTPIQLLQRVHPPLRRTHRIALPPLHPRDCLVLQPQPALHRLRQTPHRRPRKKLLQLQLHLQFLPRLRHHPDRLQRMPPQLEKVVVDPHPLHAQHLLENPAQSLLHLSSRGRVFPLHRPPIRLRQLLAIHLPVGRQGQRRQLHKVRRHHVPRQPALQVFPQSSRFHSPVSLHIIPA